MTTTNKDLNLPAYNQTVPTWDQPLNANFTIIDNALGSSTSTIDMAPGNYTLSTAEIQNMRIVVGGTLLTNRELIFPSGVGGNWIISNGSTGAFTITAKVSGGSLSVNLPQGKHLTVFSSGTELYQADDGLVTLTPTFTNLTISPSVTDNMFLVGNDLLTTNTNGVASLRVNYTGYNQGTTQFRDFEVYDGKQNLVFGLTGQTKSLTHSGKIVPRISSQANPSSISVDISSFDQYVVTALAQSLSFPASTTGSPSNGDKIIIRIKDNGTQRTLSWTTAGSGSWRAVGVTLPTFTIANKVLYVGAIYNSDESFWDVVGVSLQA